jgi:hypothetical protein
MIPFLLKSVVGTATNFAPTIDRMHLLLRPVKLHLERRKHMPVKYSNIRM